METIKNQLQDQLIRFLGAQPRFHVKREYNHFFLTGYYYVEKEHNGFIVNMCYPVSIQIPFSFPKKFPIVYFERKLVPVGFDHIYGDGSLCLETPQNIRDFLSKRTSLCPLCDFFDVYLDNFFISMEYYSKYKTLPFGERSHGQDGENEYGKERNVFIRKVRKYANSKK